MALITQGFHHVTLVSGDLARTVAFYRDVLGLRLLQWDDTGAYQLVFGDERGTPGTLVLFIAAAGNARGRPGAGGIHHHALIVADAQAQLKWKRWLEDHGVPVTGPYDRGWFRSIYFADPDGQILEIATRGPGYAVDEAADALGREVVIPPTAELRGQRNEAAIRARTHPDPVSGIDDHMRLDGIHHITGITDDVERIGDFYEAALGLRLVKRSVNQDDVTTPHWFWASYDGAQVAPRSSLTMFGGWAAGGAATHGRMRRVADGLGQTHHIAFRARDADELRAWDDHLRTLGIETLRVRRSGHFDALQFRAPDGLLMELATDHPIDGRGENDSVGTRA